MNNIIYYINLIIALVITLLIGLITYYTYLIKQAKKTLEIELTEEELEQLLNTTT